MFNEPCLPPSFYLFFLKELWCPCMLGCIRCWCMVFLGIFGGNLPLHNLCRLPLNNLGRCSISIQMYQMQAKPIFRSTHILYLCERYYTIARKLLCSQESVANGGRILEHFMNSSCVQDLQQSDSYFLVSNI